MKIVGLIPARGGSVRIKRKNMRLLNGKPLIYYTFKTAKKSKLLDDIYVSTEDKEIAEYTKKNKIKVIKRPTKYATAKASSESVIHHAFAQIDCDVLVLLQPTSPLRTAEDIDNTTKLVKKAQSSFSSYPRNKANGAVYAVKKKYFKKTGSLYAPDNRVYPMPWGRSIEIDNELDFKLVEELMDGK